MSVLEAVQLAKERQYRCPLSRKRKACVSIQGHKAVRGSSNRPLGPVAASKRAYKVTRDGTGGDGKWEESRNEGLKGLTSTMTGLASNAERQGRPGKSLRVVSSSNKKTISELRVSNGYTKEKDQKQVDSRESRT